MNTDFEDLVAETLQRRAAVVRIPANLAGLAHRARRQLRRRYVLRSGLTAATAAGLAVAIPLATQAGPQPTASSPQAQTVAYVVRHTERSIAAGAATRIEVARDFYPPSSPDIAAILRPGGGGFMPRSSMTWSHGASFRVEFYGTDQRPQLDQATVYPVVHPRKRPVEIDTTVDYFTRTWWQGLQPAFFVPDAPVAPPARCGPNTTQTNPDGEFAPSVPWLRYDLRCGNLRLAGRQRVAGVNAIKIVSAPGVSVQWILWVSPADYLPVQSLTYPPGDPRQAVLARYRWLPATPRNLALLSPPVPAGFRRVKGQPAAPVMAGPRRAARAPESIAISRPAA
jgi:hypothetical protein